MDELVKFFFSAKNLTEVDRVGICTAWLTIATILLCVIGWWQLKGIKKVSKADFIQKFSIDFFNEKARNIILLLEYDALVFRTREIEYGDGTANEKFPFFEINKKISSQLQINHDNKSDLIESYTSFDIDDLLLGHFEDIGGFEKQNLISIENVYNYFDYYIQVAWDSKEIQKYLHYIKKDSNNPDVYENFKYISQKSASFGKCKNNKWAILLLKLKWFLKS
jgi:hypothetical protein